jgi:hypothetical protein
VARRAGEPPTAPGKQARPPRDCDLPREDRSARPKVENRDHCRRRGQRRVWRAPAGRRDSLSISLCGSGPSEHRCGSSRQTGGRTPPSNWNPGRQWGQGRRQQTAALLHLLLLTPHSAAGPVCLPYRLAGVSLRVGRLDIPAGLGGPVLPGTFLCSHSTSPSSWGRCPSDCVAGISACRGQRQLVPARPRRRPRAPCRLRSAALLVPSRAVGPRPATRELRSC